jgi:hypothetical protein
MGSGYDLGADEPNERLEGKAKGRKVLATREELLAGPDFHAESQRRRELHWDLVAARE